MAERSNLIAGCCVHSTTSARRVKDKLAERPKSMVAGQLDARHPLAARLGLALHRVQPRIYAR
jgi:hypothetical protein